MSTSTIPQFDMSDRLRKALRVADLSVQDMADTLECSRNTIGNYLSGRTHPNVPTLRQWAFRCGVDYEWLRYGINEMNTPDTPGGQGISRTGCIADVIPLSGAKTLVAA